MSSFNLEERYGKSQALGIKAALIFILVCSGFLVMMMGMAFSVDIGITAAIAFALWMIAGLFVVQWKLGLKASLMYTLGALGILVMMIGMAVSLDMMISSVIAFAIWFLAGAIGVYWIVTKYYEERGLGTQANPSDVSSAQKHLTSQQIQKTKKVCPECGTQIFDEETFCSHCGSLLEEDPLAKLQS